MNYQILQNLSQEWSGKCASLEDNFGSSKKHEDAALENIKEYGFEEIKEAFGEASVPQELEFSYGGDNENFFRACNLLSLNEGNNELIYFLCSDHE